MSDDLIERVASVLLGRVNAPEQEIYRTAADIIPIIRKGVMAEVEAHLSACQYDPTPYTCLKHRLRTLSDGKGEGG